MDQFMGQFEHVGFRVYYNDSTARPRKYITNYFPFYFILLFCFDFLVLIGLGLLLDYKQGYFHYWSSKFVSYVL